MATDVLREIEEARMGGVSTGLNPVLKRVNFRA